MTTTTPAYTPPAAFVRAVQALAAEIARDQARNADYRSVLRGATRVGPLTVAHAELEEAAWRRKGCRDALYAASRGGDVDLVRVLTPRVLEADRRYAAASRAVRELTQ